MKHARTASLFALAAIVASASLLATSGCGTVNTTSTRTAPADSAVDAKTRVNDLFQEIFLSAKEVRMNLSLIHI